MKASVLMIQMKNGITFYKKKAKQFINYLAFKCAPDRTRTYTA